MACKDCPPGTGDENEIGQQRADVRTACKCCELLDSDSAIKRVWWCNVCAAYLCAPCAEDPVRRAQAATMNFGRKVVEIAQNTIAKISGKSGKNKSAANKDQPGDDAATNKEGEDSASA